MRSPGRKLTAAVAVIPFLTALVTQALPTQLVPMGDPPPRPALAFDQYAVDLREVALRPVIPAHFDFTNTGSAPVTITALEPSCGCLDPKLYGSRYVYRPGERGRFYVTLQTAGEEPGPHAYTVTVKYQDPQPREETVVFRLVLPDQKVSVEPPELLFYQLNGQDSRAVLYVSDRRPEPLQVLDARCTLEGVSVEVLPPETTDEGVWRCPIQVAVPGEFAKGGHRGLIRITTSDPEFSELTAAIYVYGSGVRSASHEE